MPATVVTTTEPLARPAPTASRAPRQWLAGIAIVLLIAACAGAYASMTTYVSNSNAS